MTQSIAVVGVNGRARSSRRRLRGPRAPASLRCGGRECTRRLGAAGNQFGEILAGFAALVGGNGCSVARGFEWGHFRGLAGPIPRMVDGGGGGPRAGCFWQRAGRLISVGGEEVIVRQKESPRREVVSCLRDLTFREQTSRGPDFSLFATVQEATPGFQAAAAAMFAERL